MSGWGPFTADIDALEVKSRLRVLRAIVRLVAGPAGEDCRQALLVALVDPDAETLAEASAAFERLSAILRRRTLSTDLAEAQEVRP
jgi:hypothetical protein